VAKVEPQDDAPFGVGSRVRVTQPRLRPAMFTISEWEPGRGFLWTSKTMGLYVEGGHAIEPTPTGSKVTLTLDFVGFLAGIIGFLGRSPIERYLELEIAGLKARCEGLK
jgi:hypothetical protein